MYQITILSGKAYVKSVSLTDEGDICDMETFINEGTTVILCDDYLYALDNLVNMQELEVEVL